LTSLGDNVWAESSASGSPRAGAPGSSDFGGVQSGALESSTVDLTEQLVNMIVAQRNFQANSQMLSTQDQITQTVINIR
jgi:flagellar hook protein FlgE